VACTPTKRWDSPTARETTLTVIAAARAIERLPDGTPITPALGHTLLALASYWPNIWPSQDGLARDLKIHRRNVNRRLAALECAGLISRRKRKDTTTTYTLDLKAIRACGAGMPKRVAAASHKVQKGQVNDNGPSFDPSEW